MSCPLNNGLRFFDYIIISIVSIFILIVAILLKILIIYSDTINFFGRKNEREKNKHQTFYETPK